MSSLTMNAPAESTETPQMKTLLAAIQGHRAKVAVIGLGYVGLPLVKVFCERGFPVIGFDVDQNKIAQIQSGKSYIKHIPAADIVALNDSGRFFATTELTDLRNADAILICVPTPLNRYREPELSYVYDTAKALAGQLRGGQIVILESTTYPGTTTEDLKPILESSGLTSDKDFFLAYSPEREDPGNPAYSTSGIPKIVGGDGPNAARLAEALYSQIVVRVVPVSNTRTAEAVKLTENIFRAVNIALVNELKLIYSAMGVDIWEVIEAARTKPFGYMPFYPGPGLGGHCIPIDPFYLTWKAREHGVPTRFIELAGEINTAMPGHIVDCVAEAVNQRSAQALNGARVLLLGIAYKKNVDDIRESPALRIIELLERRGAKVDYFDPHIPEIPVTREHGKLAGRQSISWDPEALRSYACVLICTDHDSVDYKELAAGAALVVDTRNAMARAGVSGVSVIKA